MSEKFAFTRWIAGKNYHIKEEIGKVKVIVPEDTNLPAATEEKKYIEQLGKLRGFEVSVDSTYEDVMGSLRNGGFDLLHASTHGTYKENVPTFSGIVVEKGYQVTVENISGVTASFGKDNPMVILNACQTGMQGFSLTGIQSWATRFLDSGVSIFIGTLWSVRDSTAINFVKELCDQLITGQVTIGEAVKNARIKCKEDGDPSWLAYELFAPPNLSIKLGSK